MPRLAAIGRPLHRPGNTLVIVFVAWKTLLLLIAFASPGPGYDTSTTLLLGQDVTASALVTASVPWTATLGERLASKLTRWDAIYFTAAAQRGYQHEQDWAFSWALSRLMTQLAKFLPFAADSLVAHVWAGVIISNISHLISVLVLYRLAVLMFPQPRHRKTVFLTAALHVLSPAGLFLVAPYGEALFSLLNFSGMLCYAYARSQDAFLTRTEPDGQGSTITYLLYMLASGLCFGLATMVRSNGLLSGLIFLYDIPGHLASLLRTRSEQLSSARRILCTVMAGATVGAGLMIPQWVAYQQYCVQEIRRPWCTKIPPSIYTWVQQHYWNVGFLRYWTLSNIPLFLLAAPTLWVLTTSAVRVIGRFSDILSVASEKAEPSWTERTSMRPGTPHLLAAFGLPQLALAALAVTNFHVQIVNRISSGYPVWYLAIAAGLDHTSELHSIAIASNTLSKSIFRLIIIYVVVQGVLYASFLPPA